MFLDPKIFYFPISAPPPPSCLFLAPIARKLCEQGESYTCLCLVVNSRVFESQLDATTKHLACVMPVHWGYIAVRGKRGSDWSGWFEHSPGWSAARWDS